MVSARSPRIGPKLSLDDVNAFETASNEKVMPEEGDASGRIAAWRPIDEFNLDVIYGRNLTGEESNWITVATVFRFKVGGKGEK